VSFTPPVFNLTCNAWTCDGTLLPANGPPDLTGIFCQKYVAPRAAWPVSPPFSAPFWRVYHPPVQLRFPRTSPFDVTWTLWKTSCFEVPAGSGQYYRPLFRDIQHEGFPNEYALVVCVQCDASGLTTPPAGMAAIPGPGVDPCGVAEGGGTPPVQLFLDQFLDTPGTPLESHIANTGETWTLNTTGNVQESGAGTSMVLSSADGADYFCVANYTGPLDKILEVAFVVPGSGWSSPLKGGLIFRATDANNFLVLSFDDDGFGAQELRLQQCTSGTLSALLSSGTSFSFTPGQSYRLRVIIAGDNLDFFLFESTTLIDSFSTTDSTLNTELGVGFYSVRDTGIDSFNWVSIGIP